MMAAGRCRFGEDRPRSGTAWPLAG